MDVRVLQELIECSVCLERMGPNSRVLPCQHTFCLQCLEAITHTRSELRCPECRALVDVPVHDLPSNILLIRLLESMKIAGHAGASSGGGGGLSSSIVYCTENLSQVPPAKIGAKNEDCRPPPSAQALHNYDARESGDLSFKRGDTVNLKKRIDDNWLYGECSGKIGFFPSAYVQVIIPLPSSTPSSSLPTPRARALYDFELNSEEEKDCLKLRKNDVITIMRRVDNNWLEGRLGERVGIFPASYVNLNEAAKSIVNALPAASQALLQVPVGPIQRLHARGHTATPAPGSDGLAIVTSGNPAASSSPAPQAVCAFSVFASTELGSAPVDDRNIPKRHPAVVSESQATLPPAVFALCTAHHRSAETMQPVSSDAAPALPARSAPRAAVDLPPKIALPTAVTQSCIPIYAAVFNYKPQRDDEMELVKGQLYKVTDMCRDGWYRGICLLSGRGGVFPGNYVQSVISLPKPGGNEARATATVVESQSNACHGTALAAPQGRSTALVAGTSPQTGIRRHSLLTPPTSAVDKCQAKSEDTERHPSPSLRKRERDTAVMATVKRSASSCADSASRQRLRPGNNVVSPSDATRKSPQQTPRAAVPTSSVAAENVSSRERSSHTGSPSHSLQSLKASQLERYRCVAAYPPQSEVELELQAGDVVLVHSKRPDGWYKGTHQRTHLCGLFPATFVEKC